MNNSEFERRKFLALAGKGLGLASLGVPMVASLLSEVVAATLMGMDLTFGDEILTTGRLRSVSI